MVSGNKKVLAVLAVVVVVSVCVLRLNTQLEIKIVDENTASVQQPNGQLNLGPYRIDQPNFKTYVNILMKKVVPVNLMQVGPFKFLKNYRNPCWYGRDSSNRTLRCLPYFYLVGAPKSGTTDLHKRLVQHPLISSLSRKETHWITRVRLQGKNTSGVQPGFSKYLSYYDSSTRRIFKIRDKNNFHPIVFGDSSASTLWDNDHWTYMPENWNLTEPPYTNADFIHHMVPRAKIIVILRDPVTRLYSDYLFFEKGEKDPMSFHIGVQIVMKAMNTCLKDNTLRHCLSIPVSKEAAGKKCRLRIGIYHSHLKEYLRVFPRRQLFIIKLEDFSQNTEKTMAELYKFLELPPVPDEKLANISRTDKVANSRRTKDRNVRDMFPETRKLLQDFYRPHNEELARMLGEHFNWDY